MTKGILNIKSNIRNKDEILLLERFIVCIHSQVYVFDVTSFDVKKDILKVEGDCKALIDENNMEIPSNVFLDGVFFDKKKIYVEMLEAKIDIIGIGKLSYEFGQEEIKVVNENNKIYFKNSLLPKYIAKEYPELITDEDVKNARNKIESVVEDMEAIGYDIDAEQELDCNKLIEVALSNARAALNEEDEHKIILTLLLLLSKQNEFSNALAIAPNYLNEFLEERMERINYKRNRKYILSLGNGQYLIVDRLTNMYYSTIDDRNIVPAGYDNSYEYKIEKDGLLKANIINKHGDLILSFVNNHGMWSFTNNSTDLDIINDLSDLSNDKVWLFTKALKDEFISLDKPVEESGMWCRNNSIATFSANTNHSPMGYAKVDINEKFEEHPLGKLIYAIGMAFHILTKEYEEYESEGIY